MKMWTVVRKSIRKNTWYAIAPMQAGYADIPAQATMWYRKKDAQKWIRTYLCTDSECNDQDWIVKSLVLK